MSLRGPRLVRETPVVFVLHGRGERTVGLSKAHPVWAVVPTKRGIAMWKKQLGGPKSGQHYPVILWAVNRRDATVRMSDLYANKEWPRGSLMLVKVYHTDELRDGVYVR